MRRREFITLLGGAAAAWPFASHAQQTKPVVGYLSALSDRDRPDLAVAFRRGLSEAGYIEGRNVRIEHRSADGRYDCLPALAAELVRRKVDVIVARGLPAARAAKAATSIVPIVFTSGGDPVARGLVASLNRPGGNLTGVTFLGDTLLAKRLELLRELRPGAASIALLVNPTNHNTKSEKRIIAAASARLGVRLRVLAAATDHALEQAFVALWKQRNDVLLVAGDPFFALNAKRIAELAIRVGMPSAYDVRLFVDAGGLASYGAGLTDVLRLAGRYTGRILKGERPGDLPVQRSTKFELVINLKTAKALGLTVAPTLLARADKVIE
jgi:putative ABC transport system substrate-binding protein